MRCESNVNYTEFYLPMPKTARYQTLKDFEDLLGDQGFTGHQVAFNKHALRKEFVKPTEVTW